MRIRCLRSEILNRDCSLIKSSEFSSAAASALSSSISTNSLFSSRFSSFPNSPFNSPSSSRSNSLSNSSSSNRLSSPFNSSHCIRALIELPHKNPKLLASKLGMCARKQSVPFTLHFCATPSHHRTRILSGTYERWTLPYAVRIRSNLNSNSRTRKAQFETFDDFLRNSSKFLEKFEDSPKTFGGSVVALPN